MKTFANDFSKQFSNLVTVGDVKTLPVTAAESIPRPTNPICPGSCPAPPPLISTTRSRCLVKSSSFLNKTPWDLKYDRLWSEQKPKRDESRLMIPSEQFMSMALNLSVEHTSSHFIHNWR